MEGANDTALLRSPPTVVSPANQFWGFDQAISYGASTSILASTAGIIDSGTTFVLIATDAFKRYQVATGAVLDTKTGLLQLNLAQLPRLQSLFFTINGVTMEFTANAQIFPVRFGVMERSDDLTNLLDPSEDAEFASWW